MLRRHRTPGVNNTEPRRNEGGFVSTRALFGTAAAVGLLAFGCSVKNMYEESGTDDQARLGAAGVASTSGDVFQDVGAFGPPVGLIVDATGRTANDQIKKHVVPWVAGEGSSDESQGSSSGGTSNGVPLAQLAEEQPAPAASAGTGTEDTGATATYNLLPGGGSAECEVEDDPAGDGMVDDAFRGRSPDMVGSNYGWVIKGAEASRAAGKNFVNCHPL